MEAEDQVARFIQALLQLYNLTLCRKNVGLWIASVVFVRATTTVMFPYMWIRLCRYGFFLSFLLVIYTLFQFIFVGCSPWFSRKSYTTTAFPSSLPVPRCWWRLTNLHDLRVTRQRMGRRITNIFTVCYWQRRKGRREKEEKREGGEREGDQQATTRLAFGGVKLVAKPLDGRLLSWQAAWALLLLMLVAIVDLLSQFLAGIFLFELL